MDEVTGSILSEHGRMKTQVYTGINQDIIKAIGTMDNHDDVDDFIRANPTEEEVCEYYERYGERDSSNAPDPVNPSLHKAAVSWAEENC